jgi:formate hydrogenlyase subunit 3/multisubunit Na+/H+ antiporter MnhD subunit
MLNILTLPILIPTAAALAGLLIKRLRNEFGFVGSLFTFYYAVRLFLVSRSATVAYEILRIKSLSLSLFVDGFSGLIILACSFFGLLVMLYSFRSMRVYARLKGYYAYLLLTLACANGVSLAHNFLLLLFFWGFLLALLYGLLSIGKGETADAANKAFTVIGIADFLLLLGVALLFAKTGKTDLILEPKLALSEPTLIASYILLALGCFGKAGAFPFHTWIPEAAKVAPATTMAFIPASLDKLLGIYLLARVSYSIFDLTTSLPLRIFLLTVGAITIIAPVFMALVQKEAMRLLSFHAVSQVGYMILGIGTGNPIGIAGAIFHMLNNSIYKCGLFLAAGSVEDRTKTTELDKLGGLGRQMPITLFSFIVCAFAIAGVPPLNGFFSKWMLYQGILETAQDGNKVYPIFLIVALFGSVLTLASFLKLLHSLFLGERPQGLARVRESGFGMWIATVVLAALCIVFGVWVKLPLDLFIYPSIGFMKPAAIGFWSPALAAGLIIIGIVLGLVIYLLGTAWKPMRRHVFTGGELLPSEEARMTGPHFYGPVKDLLAKTYEFGEGGSFDFYNYATGIIRAVSVAVSKLVDRTLDRFYEFLARLGNLFGQGLSFLHSGELPTYLGWIFLGMIAILIALIFGG